jgi:hypothetical protein
MFDFQIKQSDGIEINDIYIRDWQDNKNWL